MHTVNIIFQNFLSMFYNLYKDTCGTPHQSLNVYLTCHRLSISISSCRLRISSFEVVSATSIHPWTWIFGGGCPCISLQSYLRSIWQNMILISLEAKNRPGHACCPWPKPRWFGLVDTNCATFSLPGSWRIFRNRFPSNFSGSL
jgi:hypothetical protein